MAPTSADDVVYNNINSGDVTVTGTAAAHTLALNNSNLNVSGNLTIGATATVSGYLLLTGGTVTAASFDLQGGNGQIYNASGHGTINGNVGGFGYLSVNSGTLTINGMLDNSNYYNYINGGTLELLSTTAGYYLFNGANATRRLGAPASFTGQILNFALTDTLDLAGVAATSVAALNYNGNQLTITETDGTRLTYSLTGNLTGNSVQAVSDGNGGAAIRWIATAVPSIGITTTGAQVNGVAQTILGTVAAGANGVGSTVSLFDNGALVGTATVGAGGAWSTTVTLAAQGTNEIVARDTDSAGNTGYSAPVTFTLDSIAPTLTSATPALTNDTGRFDTDFVTSDGRVTFSGTVGDGSGSGVASVVVRNSTTVLGTAAVSNGAWTLSTTLVAGTYSGINVLATDAAGNTASTTSGTTIIVDQTAPTVVFTSAALEPGTDTGDSPTDLITRDGRAAFQISASDLGGAGIRTVQFYNGATLIDSTNFSPTLAGATFTFHLRLAEGVYDQLRAVVIDDAGNSTAATTTTRIVVDQTPPVATFTSVVLANDTGTSATDFITSDGRVTFSGTASGTTVVQVQSDVGVPLGTAPVINGTWTVTTTLPNGTYSRLIVVAADVAGNFVNVANPTVIVVDTTAPSQSADLSAQAGAFTVALDGYAGYVHAGSVYSPLTGIHFVTGNNAGDIFALSRGTYQVTGGTGNDIYLVDSAADLIFEAANGGFDSVLSTAATFTLPTNVEYMQVNADGATGIDTNTTGTHTIEANGHNVTLQGADGNDIYIVHNADTTITDTGGTNTIVSYASTYTVGAGVGGDAILALVTDGATGRANDNGNVLIAFGLNDTLIGGTGNDLFQVASATDVVLEGAGTSFDVVWSVSSVYTLPTNVEQIQVIRDGGRAISNAAGGILMAASNNDILESGTGDDIMYGNGLGTTFVFNGQGFGHDVIGSFTSHAVAGSDPADVVDLSALHLTGMGDLTLRAGDSAGVPIVTVTIAGDANDYFTFYGVTVGQLSASDFRF